MTKFKLFISSIALFAATLPSVALGQQNVRFSPSGGGTVYVIEAGGNDTAVDTSTLQEALTAAGLAAASGTTASVYVPAGTYYIDATLTVPANVTLFGDGPASVIKLATNAQDSLTTISLSPVLIPASVNPMIVPSQTGGPHEGITIRDIKLDFGGMHNIATDTGDSYCGILTDNSTGMRINDVTIVDVAGDLVITAARRAFCLAVINSTNTKIHGCWLNGAGYDTLTVRGYQTIQIHISDTYAADGGRTAFQVYDEAADVTAVNCTFDNTTSNGTSAGGVFFHGAIRPKLLGCTVLSDVSNCLAIFGDNDAGSAASAPRYSEDVLADGCTFIYSGTTNAAITWPDGGDGTQYTRRNTIANCHVKQIGGSGSSQGGIVVPASVVGGITLNGNQVYSDTNGPGISANAVEGFVCTNNTVTMTYTSTGTAGYAGQFTSTLFPIINNNNWNVDDPSTDVVVLTTVAGGTFSGNVCSHTSGSQPTSCVPIRLNGTDYMVVSDNQFRSGCNTAAIYIEGDCANLQIVQNRVYPGPNLLATKPSFGIRNPAASNALPNFLCAGNDLDQVTNGSFSSTFTLDSGSRLYGNITSTTAGDKHDWDQGVATIPNSGTTALIAVTHKVTQARTFTAADVSVVPTSDLGDATNYWVDTFTAGGFTINVNADPNAVVTFAWFISLENRMP